MCPFWQRLFQLKPSLRITALAVCMFASAPGLGAATGTTADGFVYTDTGSAITLNGYTGLTGAVTLPDSIVGKPVTAIADLAFFNNAVLTSVTIPSGVASIGAQAFQGCGNLTSLTMQVGVTSFGDYAFQGCGKLASLTIPSSVTSIGYQAFHGCSSLVSVTIPNSVTTLGDAAFAECPSLASVTISSSMTSLGDYLFQHCIGLTTVTIPVSVTHIGTGAFYGCSGLTGVTLPTNLTTLGPQAFAFCSGLTSLTVPSGVTDIGLNTFFECHALTSVTLLGNVTSVGEAAYAFCDHLTSVTLPSGISSIAVSTFYECVALESVTIPSNVTSIGANAFYDCVALTSLTIPAGVTSIGASAFEYCGTLKSVLFLGHAPTVGASVFGDAPLSILYYQPAATGWTNPFATRPAYTTPTVTALSPASGPTTGGDALTLTGTGFAGTPGVTVGGLAATSIVVVSDTQITATAPAGSAGARDVAVTTIAGTGSGAGLYAYYKVTPTITWAAPSAITYGAALTATQLNATASVTGTFAYSPAAGAVPAAGTQTLSVIFTPTDTANYTSANSSVSLAVGQATPTITTAPTASAISYGQTLAASSLSGGAASVSGSFAFTTPTTAPGAGSAAPAVTFTPTDAANYTVATTTVSVSVNQATPTITWATPSGIGYGVALTATQLNATASVAGTFAYSPAAGAVPAAGTQTLSVTFTPTDATNYTSANSSVSLDVGKVTPTITTAPTASAISYGQTLAASSLSGGAASVSGSFAFTTPTTAPGAGSAAQAVTFTPTDSSNYTVATTTISVSVNQATPTITWATPSAITYGTALAGTQLNATASVAGTFAYSPAAGAVPAAGTQTLGVTFTPTDASNYTVASGSAALTVGKAVLTVRADDQTRLYGVANPVLTVTYSGFKNGDTSSSLTTAPTVTTMATVACAAGTSALTPSGGVAANYTFSHVAGTLTIVACVPDAPTRVTAALGNGSADVSFRPPANNGGTAVTRYTVTATPVGGGTPLTADGAGAPITIAGLTNGTTYTFTVTATNAAGTSPASAASGALTPAIAPTVAAPTSADLAITTATLGGDVTSDGGADITARGVVYAVAAVNLAPQLGGAGVTDVAAPGTTGIFTVAATGLTPGTAHVFAAYATNGMGTSYSATGTFTTAPAVTVPGAPLGVTLTSGNGSMTVSFTAPSNGGTDITRYTITATPVGGGPALTATGTGSPITVTGLVNGTRYTFTVAASNGLGTSPVSAPSEPAAPCIPPPPCLLANISVRANLASGQRLIPGVVVAGNKPLLLRAGGPALNQFGLTGLCDPVLQVYSHTGVLMTQNDNWGTELAATCSQLGAFPFAPGSGDSALVTELSGPHTAFAFGPGAGTVLLELYDTATTDCVNRLVNVSARQYVGTGGEPLIVGFVIVGTGSKQLLIRGVGPKLLAYGVPGVLADPYLQVFDACGTQIAANDNWAAGLAATFTQVGAFGLDAGSKDAAVLITLVPGVYTAKLTGVGNVTGEGLLEVYEVWP